MSELTYGQLETGLLSLGFILRGLKEENNWFEHPATGSLIVYPVFPADQPVLERHRVTVLAILDAYGYPNPFHRVGQPQNA